MKHTYSYRLRYGDCRQTRHLSVPALIALLADATLKKSEDCGFGFQPMIERGLAWFVVDWHTVIYRRPAVSEEVTLSAWLCSVGGFSGKWQYVLKDREGKTLALASSTWGAADLEKGRLSRIPEEIKAFMPIDDEVVLPTAHPIGKLSEDDLIGEPFVFSSNECDYNYHISNVCIAERAVASLPDGFAGEPAIREFLISYGEQHKSGDTIVPHIQPTEDGCRLLLTKDGRITARIQIIKEGKNDSTII